MADRRRSRKRNETGVGNAFLTADSDAVRREPERATSSNRRARGGGEREEIRMERPESEEEEVVRANARGDEWGSWHWAIWAVPVDPLVSDTHRW